MTLRCLIIDDEPSSQLVLKTFIADVGFLELCGIANNAVEALNLLQQHSDIDLLFLDINMPKISGLTFYKSLQNPPHVIFTTAYSQYAIEGFEVNAVDYLLKPFSFDRFFKAVNKVVEKQTGNELNNNEEAFILIKSSKTLHKVNPIDFENAEGNLGIANALLEHLAAKLPISRLQRDLTDSTVLRVVGVPLAHMLISLESLQKGLGKLELNRAAIDADLEENWAVVAEAIQTILRREGFPKPYEALRDLTRTNSKITQASLTEFIEGLAISTDLKIELKAITPFTYTGI